MSIGVYNMKIRTLGKSMVGQAGGAKLIECGHELAHGGE